MKNSIKVYQTPLLSKLKETDLQKSLQYHHHTVDDFVIDIPISRIIEGVIGIINIFSECLRGSVKSLATVWIYVS